MLFKRTVLVIFKIILQFYLKIICSKKQETVIYVIRITYMEYNLVLNMFRYTSY